MSLPSIRLVAETAASFYEIDYHELLSESRAAGTVRCRQVTFYLARSLCGRSSTSIGRALGRDHSTVLYGVERITADRATDPDLAEELDAITLAIETTLKVGERVAVTPAPDHDAKVVAHRVLNEPRGVTSISIDELRTLAAAVAAVTDHDDKAAVAPPPPPPPEPPPERVTRFASGLLAALTALDNASYDNRGEVIRARQQVDHHREQLGRALAELRLPTPKENDDGSHRKRAFA